MNATRHIEALREILPHKCLIDNPVDRVGFEQGVRGNIGRALFVVRPNTTAEVSAVVGYCVRNKIHLVPQSGNTGLVDGSTPDQTGNQVLLSLAGLNQIHHLNVVNRSVHMGAGVRLSELNAKTKPHDLFFPVDLGADPMIGGMVSTNTGGSRFLRYGDVRANTLALKVVLPDEDGTILELGSAVRKNNSGVDWKQIFVGTSGSFGIVTECTMSIEPSLKQMATALITPSGDASVASLLERFESRFGALLTAFETMSGAAVKHALSHVPSLRNPFSQKTIPDISLLVELGAPGECRGGDHSLEAQLLAFLSEIWEESTSLIEDALICPPAEIWRVRHSLSEGVRNAGDLFAFDLGFRRDLLMSFRSDVRNRLNAEYPELEVCDFGHAGDGGIHLNLVRPKNLPAVGNDFEDQLRDFVVDIAVNDYDGSFSAEHGLGRKNQKYYNRHTEQKIKDLSGQVKNIMGSGLASSFNFAGMQPA